MAKLSSIQRMQLEKYFEMESGYVLDFSDRTFQVFFADVLGIDIDDPKYKVSGTSKANRLRTFFRLSSNSSTKEIIIALIERKKLLEQKRKEYDNEFAEDVSGYLECIKIANSFDIDETTEALHELEKNNVEEIDLRKLLKSIRESVEKQEPEMGLDRLHTYCVKYIRRLCDKHGIIYDENKPLHSCFGEYVKHLKKNQMIETDMTESILKSSISLLSDYNYVRNRKSYAHDNPILNYSESILILHSITGVLLFLESIETKQQTKPSMDAESSFLF